MNHSLFFMFEGSLLYLQTRERIIKPATIFTPRRGKGGMKLCIISQSEGSISSPHARSSFLGYLEVRIINLMIIYVVKSNYAEIWHKIFCWQIFTSRIKCDIVFVFKKYVENQVKVQRLIDKGYSVYITGKGASGKSFFISSVVEDLRARDICCFVTAPTGKAANNISGITIHSFAGIGKGSKGAHELISIITSDEDALLRWQNCDVLVFDEVSMLSRELFEKLEMIARCLKKSSKPFGGNTVNSVWRFLPVKTSYATK
jgi:hypothetical protein